MIVFDIESNGLLDTISKVHCINAIDYDTGEEMRFTDHETYLDPYTGEDTGEAAPRTGTIADALQLLAEADAIGGHNIIDYDLPALRIVYPDWNTDATLWDSRVMARVMYTNLKERDFAALRKGKLPAKFENRGLVGKHSLEAWGIRVGGDLKADFKPSDYGRTWANAPFSKDMDDYCIQDVRTNVDVFAHFFRKNYSERCLRLEHDVARIIGRQQRVGFEFDEEKAVKLLGELQTKHAELADSLTEVFQPWYTWDGKDRGRQTPKRSMRRWVQNEYGAHTRKVKGEVQRGWYEERTAGGEFSKIKLQVFNPTSRQQIANRLQKVHGWKPKDFTPSGQAKIDEAVLKALPYPEAQQLADLFEIDKKIGQIATGKNAWLKHVKTAPDHTGRMATRIHGRVNTNGAVTGRMSHSQPNVAQVDKDPEMRSCWIVRPGYRLVGCDADGLELRCLAHYMSRWDDGEYAKVVVEGKKEDASDNHSVNQRVIGLRKRDNAKTWVYAFLYGAGDPKLGSVVVDDFDDEKRERFNQKFRGRKREQKVRTLGARSRDRIAKGLPALGKLIERVKKKAGTGSIRGLDGRQLHIRSAHSALNTLLQGAGAVLMKEALVLLDKELIERGYTHSDMTPDYDYEFVANVHDEFQIEVKEEHAEEVGRLAADAIRRAGETLDFRVPLAGSSDIGATWAETH